MSAPDPRSSEGRGTQRRVRVDKRHPQIYRAQLEVARAVRAAAAEAGFDRILVELVNIRVSQINGCAYCLHIHVRDALANGESTQRLAVLPAWRDTTLFTDDERAALTLAESLTTLPDAGDRETGYAQAAAHLTREQMSALIWVVVTMNAFNRLSIASRHEVRAQTDTLEHRNSPQQGAAP